MGWVADIALSGNARRGLASQILIVYSANTSPPVLACRGPKRAVDDCQTWRFSSNGVALLAGFYMVDIRGGAGAHRSWDGTRYHWGRHCRRRSHASLAAVNALRQDRAGWRVCVLRSNRHVRTRAGNGKLFRCRPTAVVCHIGNSPADFCPESNPAKRTDCGFGDTHRNETVRCSWRCGAAFSD